MGGSSAQGTTSAVHASSGTTNQASSSSAGASSTGSSSSAEGASGAGSGSSSTPAGPSALPLSVTGFNEDLVAEGTLVRGYVVTSTVFDAAIDPSSNVFYARGYSSPLSGVGTRGLPEDGAIQSVSIPGVRYQLNPYAVDNVLLLVSAGDAVSGGANAGTLALAEPTAMSVLWVLGTGNQGNAQVTADLLFADGTHHLANITLPDWFGLAGGAISGFGRMRRTDDTFRSVALDDDPTLYDVPITLTAAESTKPLLSVTFTWLGPAGARGGVLALSAQR